MSTNLQISIGLSDAETEFYALCRNGAYELVMKSFFADLGMNVLRPLFGFKQCRIICALVRGRRRQRHVRARYLWIQERLACKHFRVKIRTERNTADMLTRVVGLRTSKKHLEILVGLHWQSPEASESSLTSPSVGETLHVACGTPIADNSGLFLRTVLCGAAGIRMTLDLQTPLPSQMRIRVSSECY